MSYTASYNWHKAYRGGGKSPLIVCRIGIGSSAAGADSRYRWLDVSNRPYAAFDTAGATTATSGPGTIFGVATQGVHPILMEMDTIGQKLDSWSLIQTVGQMQITLQENSLLASHLATPNLQPLDSAIYNRPLEIYLADESLDQESDWLPIWFGVIDDCIGAESGTIKIKASTLSTVFDKATFGGTWYKNHPVKIAKRVMTHAMTGSSGSLGRFGFSLDASSGNMWDSSQWTGITSWNSSNLWGAWNNCQGLGSGLLSEAMWDEYDAADGDWSYAKNSSFIAGYPSGSGGKWGSYKKVNARKLLNQFAVGMLASLVFDRDKKIKLKRQNLDAEPMVHFETSNYQDFEQGDTYGSTICNQITISQDPGQGTKFTQTREDRTSTQKYGKHEKVVSFLVVPWAYHDWVDLFEDGTQAVSWVSGPWDPPTYPQRFGVGLRWGAVLSWTGNNDERAMAGEIGLAQCNMSQEIYSFRNVTEEVANDDGWDDEANYLLFPVRTDNGQLVGVQHRDSAYPEDESSWIYNLESSPARIRLEVDERALRGTVEKFLGIYWADVRAEEPGEQQGRIPPYGYDHTQIVYYTDKQLSRFKRGAPEIRFKVELQYAYLDLGDIVTIDNDTFFWESIPCDFIRWEIVGIEMDLLSDQPGVMLTCRYAKVIPTSTIPTNTNFVGVSGPPNVNWIPPNDWVNQPTGGGVPISDRPRVRDADWSNFNVIDGLKPTWVPTRTGSNTSGVNTPTVYISPGTVSDGVGSAKWDPCTEPMFKAVDSDGYGINEITDTPYISICFNKNNLPLASCKYRIYMPTDGGGFIAQTALTSSTGDKAFALDPTYGAPLVEFEVNASKEPLETSTSDIRKHAVIPINVMDTRLLDGRFDGDFEQWPLGPKTIPGGWQWTGKTEAATFNLYNYGTAKYSYTGGNSLRFNEKDGSYLDSRRFRIEGSQARTLETWHYLLAGNATTGVTKTKIRIRFWDSDDSYIATSTEVLSETGTNAWKKETNKLTTPAGAQWASVGIYRDGIDASWDNSGSNATFIYLDNISFKADEASGGASAFLALTDTPASYSGKGYQFATVKSSEDALEFSTLSDQFGREQPTKDLRFSGGSSTSPGITFFSDGTRYHGIFPHSLSGAYSDDIRINSYGSMIINMDSNSNNSSAADFIVCQKGTYGSIGDINHLFTVIGGTGNKAGNAIIGGPGPSTANDVAVMLMGELGIIEKFSSSQAPTAAVATGQLFTRSTLRSLHYIESTGTGGGKIYNLLDGNGASFQHYIFRGYIAAPLTMAANTETTVAWTTLHDPQAGQFSSGTTWKAPQDGFYNIHTMARAEDVTAAQFGSSGSPQIAMYIVKGSDYYTEIGPVLIGSVLSDGNVLFEGSSIIELDKDEEIKIKMVNTSLVTFKLQGFSGVPGQRRSTFEVTAARLKV